jgi:hypothetical protein
LALTKDLRHGQEPRECNSVPKHGGRSFAQQNRLMTEYAAHLKEDASRKGEIARADAATQLNARSCGAAAETTAAPPATAAGSVTSSTTSSRAAPRVPKWEEVMSILER